MDLVELRDRANRALDEVERAVVGKRGALELILLALLSDGHVLLEDYPGLAKTLIARSFAQATSLRFARIQFTPDLMPSDVTGSSIFDQRHSEFTFLPGPIFTNLLLADEINRAPPKTQAALLEAMQERQVTTEGETRPLAPPFMVLATQNPIEYEGTYPLPEAQLDRFLIRIGVGYPSREHEIEMLSRRLARGEDEVELSPVVDAATLVEMQRSLEQVHVADVDRGLHRRPRRRDARVAAARRRREPARQPRAAEAVAREGGARRAGLRRPRGREGGRGAGARAPADAAAGAVGAARPRRGRRRRGARGRADAAGRGRARRSRGMTRIVSPRLAAYAGLAAIGLIAGLAAGRVELVALAAPFALAAVAGAALARDPGIEATLVLDRERALESEDVEATARTALASGRRPRRGPAAAARRAPVACVQPACSRAGSR